MLLYELLAQIIALIFQELIGVVVSNFASNVLGISV